jgi:histidinol dehydrogenase
MIEYINPNKDEWVELVKRPVSKYKSIEPLVEDVFLDVKHNGDKSLFELTEKFDKIKLNSLIISPKDFKKAERKIPKKLKAAIKLAKINIEKFHLAQKTNTIIVETQKGVKCWQEKKPIEKVGLYIPGGSAPLFSTVLMLAIPAKIANCREVIVCTPPDKNGSIPDVILYTASLCGVSKIYPIGGIQAIAAMTFGTESISKVFKIFGPGNQYVNVAKQFATQYNVSIDLPAGPSELLVLADSSSNFSFIAADLLSQAEHGEDSQVVLVSLSKEIIRLVKKEILIQVDSISRKEIAMKSLKNSKFIYFSSNEIAADFINEYAPEHYIISTSNEDFFTSKILNAGSVFLGKYTPESAGDYASGTNHTLPTNGHAKQYSGVNLDSFLKAITFQKISSTGIKNIGNTIEIMAKAEGLDAHKNAVTIRLKNLK